MKEWLFGLFKFIFRVFLMNFPSHRLRMFFLKRVLRSVGQHVFIAMGIDVRGRSGNISIGNNSIINHKVILDGRGGEIAIGQNVDIGEESAVWTLEHDPNDSDHGVKGAAVIIEDYVWIATRVTILPGVKVGRGAVVACNSVVTKDVPAMAIVGGVPAKVIGKRENELNYKLNYKPHFL